MTAASSFRMSDYFKDRVRWTWMIRSASGMAAASMQAQLAGFGPSAHIYVNSGQEIPWLFAYGDCVYPRLSRHSPSIECTIRKPEPELRTLYERDSSERYFLDYAPGGKLSVRFSSRVP
jgi:hypothetical protein